MNTDKLLLLYTCLQFGYHKHVRTRYKLNVNQLHVLTSIYYALKVNPKRWKGSVKQCIRTLNPQMRPQYILRDLHVLNDKELITYNEINPKNYGVKLTKEGERVIIELFDAESITTYIEGEKDKI